MPTVTMGKVTRSLGPGRVPAWIRLVGLIAIAISLGLALKRGVQNSFPLPVRCHIDECLALSGASDMHSYLVAGNALLAGESPSGDFAWIFRLWPPGMPILDAMAIAATRGSYVVPVVVGVSFCLWLTALALPMMVSRSPVKAIVCAAFGIAIPHMYFMSAWPLGAGLLTSDGISTTLLLIGLYCWLLADSTRKRRSKIALALASMVTLAACAYTRSIGELFANVVLVLVLGWAAVSLLGHIYSRIKKSSSQSSSPPGRGLFGTRLRTALVIILSVQAMLFPWRAYMHVVLDGGWTFSVYGDYLWREAWMPATEWGNDALTIRVTGRDHMCESYPDRCATVTRLEHRSSAPFSGSGYLTEAEYRELYLRTVLGDPVPWIKNRTSFFPTYYGLGNSGETRYAALLTLVGLVATIALAVVQLARRRNPILLVLTAGVIISVLLPIALTHFEARYFLPLQLFGLVGLTSAVISRGRAPRE